MLEEAEPQPGGLISSGSRDADPNPEVPEAPVERSLGEVPVEVSQEGRKPKAKKIPATVSKEEYDEHCLTHIPLRSWCDHCMEGKVKEDDHKARLPSRDPQEVPRVCLDYCFLGRAVASRDRQDLTLEQVQELKMTSDEADGAVPVLTIVDEKTGCIFAGAVAKGVNPYSMHPVVEALKFLGRQRVILFCDAEPSIKALAEAGAAEFKGEVQLMVAPRESHASNGIVERGILELSRQARTLVSAIESKFPTFRILPGEIHYPWLIRHSAWLLTRYLIKKDGRSAYERLRGREFKGEIVELYEQVHFKVASSEKQKLDSQTNKGIWLGKTVSSDEHLIGTAKGIRRCRSLWRMPEERRWSLKAFTEWSGLPWQPKGNPTMVPGTPGFGIPGTGVAVPTTPGQGRRGVYITLARQLKYGPTPNCQGRHCLDDDPKKHSDSLWARRREQRCCRRRVTPRQKPRVVPRSRPRVVPRRVREAPPRRVRAAPPQQVPRAPGDPTPGRTGRSRRPLRRQVLGAPGYPIPGQMGRNRSGPGRRSEARSDRSSRSS